MQTIGNFLIVARKKKKLSITHLSQKTKIKHEYIEALENENWTALPNFATAVGFVKTITTSLDVSPVTALALLRREFPPEKIQAVKKTKFIWNPRMTTIVTVTIISITIIAYFINQYRIFVAPPPLKVSTKRLGNEVIVSGQTGKQASVLLNNEPLLLKSDGTFQIAINAQTGQKLTIEAISRNGKGIKQEITAP